DASRPRRAKSGGALPRGPLLPPERRVAETAAAVRAARRYPAAGDALSAQARRAVQEAGAFTRARRDGGPDRGTLARQRPAAAQSARAGVGAYDHERDPGDAGTGGAA